MGRAKRTPKKPAKLDDAGVDSEDEVFDEESEEEQPKKKRKTAKKDSVAKKPKKEAAGDSEGLPEGWTVHQPSLLYKYVLRGEVRPKQPPRDSFG